MACDRQPDIFRIRDIFPGILRHPYRLWMSLALVMGWFVTRIVLMTAFWLIMTTSGWLPRAIGKDLLDEKIRKIRQPTGRNMSLTTTRNDIENNYRRSYGQVVSTPRNVEFFKGKKKWWLLPIIIFLLLLSALIVFT